MSLFLRYVAAALVTACCVQLPAAAAGQKLYVLWSAKDSVSAIDVATHDILTTIEVGELPHGIASPASQELLYVSAEGADLLTVVDTRSDEVVARYPVGGRPNEIDVTSDGRFVYIPALADGTYEVFDTETEAVVARIPTDGFPHNVVISPDDRWAYLSPMDRGGVEVDRERLEALGLPTSFNEKIYVVDAVRHEVVATVPLADAPRPIALHPSGDRLFANRDGLLGFEVIDLEARRVVATAHFELTREERATPSRSHGIGVTPDGREVWSTDINNRVVHVFDVSGEEPRHVARLPTGATPTWLTVTPDGATVYVANAGDDTISVYDVASKSERGLIRMPEGSAPKRMLVVDVPASTATATAFVDVNVVPLDREHTLSEQTVLVRGERIIAMGPSSEVTLPDDARRIEGAGRYLVPGLAEMHAHLPGPQTDAALTENLLFLYVASGVTTVRGMQGQRSHFALRQRADSGELVAPRMILGSPAMSGQSVTTVAEAERLVREYAAAGFDLVKVHEGLAPEVYEALARTARELGLRFGGHVPNRVGLLQALAAGQATIDHLDGYLEALLPEGESPEGLGGIGELVAQVDLERLPRIVEATLQAGAGVVPTMVLWESALFPHRDPKEVGDREELRYVPRELRQQWREAAEGRFRASDPEANRRVAELRRRVLQALDEAGVTILLGSDSPQILNVPGFSLHREMALYLEAGMAPYEVLVSGTRNVAEHLGQSDAGTIAPGKRADLVLVERNPLEDLSTLSRPAGVMVRGKWHSRREIEARLQTIAEAYAPPAAD